LHQRNSRLGEKMRFWGVCDEHGVFVKETCGVYADFFGVKSQCLYSDSKTAENAGNGWFVLSTGNVPITLATL
jgi:hypothetical protein